jgi:hypothetical protein
MFSVEYIQQCTNHPNTKGTLNDIDTKNYCHFKPKCVKCSCDHLTNQCHRKERSSDIRSILCDGNHPMNYMGFTVYKVLRNILSSSINQANPIHSTRSNICPNNTTKFLRSHKYRARGTHKPISSGNQRYGRIKKICWKLVQTNDNYAKPPHNPA